MSLTKALAESQFLRETTFHGFVYLRHSKSKIRLAFWLTITISAMAYAAFEVAREVKRVSSEVQFEVTYRLAKRHEIQFPFWSLCHKNPFDVLDWQAFLIFKQMNNWTVADMGDLILTSGYFEHIPFARKKSADRLRDKLVSLGWFRRSTRARNPTHEETKLIAKQCVSIMIKKQFCNSNCSMCGKDNDRGASTTASIRLFQVAEYTCKVIFCQPRYSAQSQVDRPRIDFTHFDWKSNQANEVRMKFMRYMLEEHDSNLPLNDQLYLIIDSESPIIALKRNAINDFNVRPLMHNWASNAHVPCKKRVCMDDKHGSSCYSGSSEILGVDCFTWKYEIQSITNKLIVFQGNITDNRKLNTSFEATHLVLLFPYYNEWSVREYKPLFVWYKVLSNIGGTLSIWTGASVLSFLHLFQSFCCRSLSHSRKIEPIIIGRQFV